MLSASVRDVASSERYGRVELENLSWAIVAVVPDGDIRQITIDVVYQVSLLHLDDRVGNTAFRINLHIAPRVEFVIDVVLCLAIFVNKSRHGLFDAEDALV